jgi:phage tail sheath gpL-like
MGTIYTNVGANWYVPGIYVNVELGRGTPSAALQSRKVLLVGNMLDNSTFSLANYPEFYDTNPVTGNKELLGENTKVYSIPSQAAATLHFGHGTELSLMTEAAFNANPNVDLYCYVQPKGGTATATTDTIEVTEDAPTSGRLDGVIKIEILGRTCNARVKKTDNPIAVVNKITTAFNGQLRDLPIACKKDTGASPPTIEFVAKHPGVLWNGISVKVDQGETAVLLDDASTPYTGIVAGGDGMYNLENGAFSDASPLEKERFHYFAISGVLPDDAEATDETANIGRLANFLDKQALPEVGFRQQGLVGSTSQYSEMGHMYDLDEGGCINPRVQCVWAETEFYFPCQLAAAVSSTRQKWEGSDVAVNLCYKDVTGVPMVSDIKLMTSTQKNKALLEGVTPLVPHNGRMAILRSVTCAANADIGPVIDTGKVTVSDFLADDIEIKMATRYKGFKLSPDTDVPLASRVTTPSNIKKSLLEWLRENEKAGRITRVNELADGVKVEIDNESPGRVNFVIPEDVVDIFAVGAGNIIQIG